MARISLIFLAAVAAKSAVAAQAAYYQCGGLNWTGETSCVDGWECQSQNPYYYQCVQGTATATEAASTSSAASVVATTSAQATTSHAAAAPSSVKTSAAAATTSAAVQTSSASTVIEPEAATSSAAAETTLATSTTAAASSSASAAAAAVASSSSGDPNALDGAAGDGTSGSGTTTRYWDCCKPSCAWPDKASVNSPVDTCDASGNVLTDANAASGCSSGTAYMCADQTPFEVNSTMAYGFAAVNIAGGTESSWCCGCYELTFTSGTISGKTMIVQATNTGGDLNSNQFDIAIPGGGVGLFNGCATQYGTSWGSTYGGVSSAADCDSLPTALQAGCNFRFGWFDAADNPSVDWKSVQCPAELTAKSGCARQ